MVLKNENNPIKVLIVGAGDGGQVVMNIIDNMHDHDGWKDCFKTIGFIDDFKTGYIDRIPIFKFDDIDNIVFDKIIISISSNLKIKKMFFNKIQQHYSHDKFINAVHPTSFIESTAEIGVGNIIGAFVYIGHKTVIGDNNLISSHCSIEHHNIIGSHNTFGPGISTSGRVKIGSLCTFGSRIMPHVQIGDNVLIAGNIPIWSDISDNTHIVYDKNIYWKNIRRNNKKMEYII